MKTTMDGWKKNGSEWPRIALPAARAESWRWLSRLTVPVVCAFGALSPLPASADFIPGEGGAIPAIAPLEGTPGRIGGLMATRMERRNNTWGGGTYAKLTLEFPPPSSFGAAGFRLQRSLDGTNWEDHPVIDGFLETISAAQDNFDFTPGGNFHYRLLVQGGPQDGQFSNEVFADVSLVDTYFASWGLDEGVWITGVMSPFVGCGLEASFGVANLSDFSAVEDGLSYQWYRLNPLSSEMIPIPGATGLLYVTTEDDVGGYQLVCKATGDGEKVGGFSLVRSMGGVKFNNLARAVDVSANGFRLELLKSVPSLSPGDLTLDYWNGIESVVLPVTGITALPGNAAFDIAVEIPAGEQGVWLSCESEVWALVSEMFPGSGFFMRGLEIRLPAFSFEDWIATIVGIPTDRRGPLDRNGPLGLQNLCAYAMALDPLTATPQDLPLVSALDRQAGSLHLIYRRSKTAEGVTLRPEVSTSLDGWVPANVISEQVIEETDDWQRIDALIEFPAAPSGFIRVAAEVAPPVAE